MTWRDWNAWLDLFNKWTELYVQPIISGQIGYDTESLKAVYEWLMLEAGDRDLEVLYIDLLLDPSMSFDDAKKALKTVLEKPLTFDELKQLQLKRVQQLKEIIKSFALERPIQFRLLEEQLRVGDARQRDVGRGIARIDQRAMQKLDISAGDVVEIVGKRTTSAIAWPAYSEDQNRDMIRIDGFTRKNAGMAINEYVLVRPAKVKSALSITLTPVDIRLNVDEDFTNFVKNRLMERTLVEGDTTLVMMLGHAIPFTVTKTRPDGIVKITAETNLHILPFDMSGPTGPMHVELASISDIENLKVDVEVLRKEYDIMHKCIKLNLLLKVKFNDLERNWAFAQFLNETQKLSDTVEAHRQLALNELESIKNNLRKVCDNTDFPISIDLLTIGKTIVEKMLSC